MRTSKTWSAVWRSLSLPEIRGLLREHHGWAITAGMAMVFAFISMLIGGMVTLAPVQGVYGFELLGWTGTQSWWFYPEFLAVQPWGIVQLPWFPTLAMAFVSLGAGMGSAAGILLIAPLLRSLRHLDRNSVAGVAAGTTPAVAAFATVGACCCTSCGTAAGLVVVAAASGTSVNVLLLNTWYLGVFQMAVVYAALLFQDRALRASSDRCPAPRLDRALVATSILRLGLLIAGITWLMAMLVEWAGTNPWTAPAPIWYHWVFEHMLLSGTAIVAALFPAELAAAEQRWGSHLPVRLARVALAVAAVSWGGWVIPALVQQGLGGFLNELFGYLGWPVTWGAVAPDAPAGAALYFHWAFQHLLLAGFALVLAVLPVATLRRLNRPTGAFSDLPKGSHAEREARGTGVPVLAASGDHPL